MTQPPSGRGEILKMAAEWHARIDSADMDWEAFGAWLGADPAHRAAYDDIALLDIAIDEDRAALQSVLPANDAEPEAGDAFRQFVADRRVRRWWAGGGLAVAASLAVLIMPQLPFFAGEALVAYRTGPGETRAIALQDGSRIVVDRNSELALRDGASPLIEMKGGSAYFDIRHNPDRTMVIRAGDYEVRDIGTRFDLVRTPDHLAVSVAEGQVTVAPVGGKGIVLTAGHRVDVGGVQDAAAVRTLDTASVGSWQDGRLVYNDTPLALVAVDLSRYAGRTVSVDPSVADMRLSGVLTIGDGKQLVGQIEALLPIRATTKDSTIRLVRAR